ncbi:MAG TPA: polysaccharide pyruvyl transferase CsaB [Spirochaetia bacterium]|nr:polysaccharide pyruvyl transferase CsaB [Spirochaetia bacterium]
MPSIAISGYYGFNNCGDEAMLGAMVAALRDRLPGCDLTVFSKDPQTTESFHGVRAVARDNLWAILGCLSRADLLISGGGGLLQDVTGWPSIAYYLGVVKLARLQNKPVFFYGQGIGPVRTNLGRVLMRNVVNQVNLITVRDEGSREELERLGVRKPPVRVTADPALGLDVHAADAGRGWQLLSGTGATPGLPVAGVSVRNWRGSSAYLDVIARVADDLSREGWQVVLVPMHYPADLGPSREVLERMHTRGFLLEQPCSYLDLLDVFTAFRFIVGMRLHFLIFGALFNLPLAGIAYDPKINHFLKLMDLPLSQPVAELDYATLTGRVRWLLSEREALGEKTAGIVASLKKKAETSADLVRDFLLART